MTLQELCIFGTLALRAEHQSAQTPEIKNGSLGLYGAKHWKCNRMLTLGFEGLKNLWEIDVMLTHRSD